VSAELARTGELEEQLRTVRQELETQREEVHFQQDALRLYQRQLEESRERYAELYERAPTPYLSLGASGIILSINLAARVWLAAAAKQLIGSPLLLLVRRFRSSCFHETSASLSAEGFCSKDGTRIDVGFCGNSRELLSTVIHEFATNKLVYLTVVLPMNRDEAELAPSVVKR
jgi:PAS domain-containing protein